MGALVVSVVLAAIGLKAFFAALNDLGGRSF